VVNLHHVPDGVYDRGGSRTNPVEARVVADLVVAHAEAQALLPSDQRQSIGVIAFSEAQMLQILSELEARKRVRPELEPLLAEEGSGSDEGLFVKNLESVQGDERDVVIFSVGYGPDADGRLTMNFGPLNLPGGERRLNVAATRARRQLTVVSSVRAHQIMLTASSREGLRQLKRYLEFAERGPSAILDGQDGTGGEPASAFEAAVQAALAAELKGTPGLERYEVEASVGVGLQPVDLAVRDETGRYVLAIECDGETYRDLPTARDRDRLRQEVLGRLGWPLRRVWSTDWIVAQRDELPRLVAAVERGRQVRDGLILDDATPLSVLKPPDRPADGRTRPDWIRPVDPPHRSAPPPREDLTPGPSPTRRGETRGVLPPLHDLGRPEGMSAVPASSPRGPSLPVASPLFAPRSGGPSVDRGERGRGGEVAIRSQRTIDQVDHAEIAGAMRAVLTRELAMPHDALVVAVARELGYSRTGSRIRSAVASVLDDERRRGILREVGGNVSLAPPDP
jgi:very-short-patch-repair endonuclease